MDAIVQGSSQNPHPGPRENVGWKRGPGAARTGSRPSFPISLKEAFSSVLPVASPQVSRAVEDPEFNEAERAGQTGQVALIKADAQTRPGRPPALSAYGASVEPSFLLGPKQTGLLEGWPPASTLPWPGSHEGTRMGHRDGPWGLLLVGLQAEVSGRKVGSHLCFPAVSRQHGNEELELRSDLTISGP